MPQIMQSGGAKPLTGPELAVKQWLDDMGVEYLVQPKVTVEIGGRRRRLSPDFLVPSQRLVIEANGCFVHGCRCLGDRGLVHNRDRDDVRLAAFERAGYDVEVIWQHELPGLTSAATGGRVATPARPPRLRSGREAPVPCPN